jgi:hypothetical protein
MLQADCPNVRNATPEWIRRFFVAHSVSVSTYEDGIIRLAVPDQPFTQGEMDLLAWVLRRCRFDKAEVESSTQCSGFAVAEVA